MFEGAHWRETGRNEEKVGEACERRSDKGW